MKKLFLILLITTLSFQSCSQSVYENITYSYQVKIPTDWKLIGKTENDSIKDFSIIEWSLPKNTSKSDNTEIENTIEVYAYKNSNINSIAELLEFEKRKWQTFLLDIKISTLDSDNTREIVNTSKLQSFDHKSKKYLIFNNDICYRIQFVSTPETFDKNLPIFEKFYKELKINTN